MTKRWPLLIFAGAWILAAHAAERGFVKADADKDGKISKAEYTALLKQRFESQGKEGYKKAAEFQFKRKDKSSDSFLDEEEFTIKVKNRK